MKVVGNNHMVRVREYIRLRRLSSIIYANQII